MKPIQFQWWFQGCLVVAILSNVVFIVYAIGAGRWYAVSGNVVAALLVSAVLVFNVLRGRDWKRERDRDAWQRTYRETEHRV